MPPAIIAAGVVAAGTIGGAVLSSSSQKSAANKAAQVQQQATDSQLQLGRENIGFQQGIYDKNTALLSPFVQRGNAAGNQINSLLGLGGQPPPAPAANNNAMNGGTDWAAYVNGNPDALNDHNLFHQNMSLSDYGHYHYAADGSRRDLTPYQQHAQTNPVAAQEPLSNPQSATDALNNFANSAGMQFQLQQGTNAIANNRAAQGGFQSGAALKALQGYGQNTALNNYFMPYLGLLQGQQATGAQSGSAIAGVGSNFGNTVSSIYGGQQNAIGNAADATSNAALLRGQANAGFGNSVGSALGTFGSSFFQPNSGSGFNSAAFLNTPSPVSLGIPQPLSSMPVNWGSGY